MADYWKSNPRHYCDVCKCWFGENNISVSMHENGRRHKGNVERMLRQTRSNAAKREKEEIRTAAMLAKIESDALKSMSKNREISYGVPSQEALVRAEIEREQEKVQIKQQLMRHSMDLANKAKNKEQTEMNNSGSSQPASSSQVSPPWQQLVSPEGYPYYYNSSTGETQWELPSDSVTPTSSISSATATSPVVTCTTTAASTTSATTSTDQQSIIGSKRSSEERGDADQASLEPPSAKLVSPYGGWTTVAVRPQEVIVTEEEEEEDQEGSSHDSSDNEEEEKGKKFKEKTAPLLSTGSPEPEITPGAFKGFSFKKRTSTNKPQIRQRTSDFS